MKEIIINIEGEIGQDDNTVEAIQKEIVPYSGKTVKDGRGLTNLLKQINI